MISVRALAALVLLLPLSVCSPAPQEAELMTWPDLLARDRPEPSVQIKTGPADTDTVDLWMPETKGPHPVVLMVHGGCWQKSIADRTLMNYAAEDLRRRDIAVWNIEYRGVDEEGGGYPGTFLDVASAADALADHAEAYDLDLDRVAAFGHSAGGHLALWYAARDKIADTSPLFGTPKIKLKGVLNSGGLADLQASAPVTQAGCLADILNQLTGPASDQRPDVFSDTSPSELLPFGVRQVSVNGADDAIAPPALGEAYTAKARASGDVADAITIPSSGHVELIAPHTAAFERQAEILIEMLEPPAD